MRFQQLRSASLIFLGAILPLHSMGQTLSFKECVQTTLDRNPEMEVSAYRLEQAQQALNQSNAHRMPQITLSATASNSNDALNVFGMKLQQRQATFDDFGAGEFTGPGSLDTKPKNLNEPGSHNDFNTRLEVLIPVWNGGRVSGYQDQARAMIDAAQHGDVAVQQYLTFNVYQAYEGVHTAKSFVNVARQAVKAAKAYVDTTDNLVKQGVLVKSELLSAKVHLSQSLTSLEKAQAQEMIAKDNLRTLMNFDVDKELYVGKRMDIKLPAKSLAEMISMATTVNPELEAARDEVRSARSEVDTHQADNYPSFNLMARGDTHDEGLGFDSTSYTVAGVFSWKLTDFGVTSSKVDQARAQVNEKQAALKAKENMTRLEVLKSWRMLRVAQKQVAANELAVEQAEEAQRLVMKRYKGGVATITEVLASQAQLDKTRADLVQSEFETNIQKAKLRLATGTMSLDQL